MKYSLKTYIGKALPYVIYFLLAGVVINYWGCNRKPKEKTYVQSYFIPAGIWEVNSNGYLVSEDKSDTIFINILAIPSGTTIKGAGRDKSIIKLRANTLYEANSSKLDSISYYFQKKKEFEDSTRKYFLLLKNLK